MKVNNTSMGTQIMTGILIKEMRFCHKLKLSNPYYFAT